MPRRAETLDGEIVDSHEKEATLDEPGGGIRGQPDEVGVELIIFPEAAVGRLKEEAAGVCREAGGLQVRGRDVVAAGVLDDMRRAYERRQRHRLPCGGPTHEAVRCGHRR